jgi:hypothetical protein
MWGGREQAISSSVPSGLGTNHFASVPGLLRTHPIRPEPPQCPTSVCLTEHDRPSVHTTSLGSSHSGVKYIRPAGLLGLCVCGPTGSVSPHDHVNILENGPINPRCSSMVVMVLATLKCDPRYYIPWKSTIRSPAPIISPRMNVNASILSGSHIKLR